MADIVLINPRFEVSYWGLEYALPMLGKKCNLPTACLPLLAALTPDKHSVTIVDENVEPIDFDRLALDRHAGEAHDVGPLEPVVVDRLDVLVDYRHGVLVRGQRGEQRQAGRR